MGIKKILDNVQKAVSIAQAGIKGTLDSLNKTPFKAKKRAVRTGTPKKKIPSGGKAKPAPKREQERRARNPSTRVIKSGAVIPRKSSKPARKSKQSDRP
jgi:hypothetical protein